MHPCSLRRARVAERSRRTLVRIMKTQRCTARPWAARLVRTAVVILPAVAGAVAAWEVARVLGSPSGFLPTFGWLAVLITVAVVAVVVTERLARRLLPLAWLLRLSLAFPDRAPP